jgi:NAD(P)-dependent dehydrogenase (short-subunit alcohol dehydrogenase family)
MGALDGKVAIITGGSSGIGRATTELFLQEGAEVLVVDLHEPPDASAFVAADVGDPAAWAGVVDTAQSQLGGVDIAYLNAGVTTGESDITKLTDEQYRRIMRPNLDGVVFGARAVVPAIERRGGGAVVATASLAGLIAFPPDPVYTATKHAVVGLVRALAPQLEAKGITINAICPGIVRTPLVGEEIANNLEAAGFPLIEPADIAAAVLMAATGKETGQAYACQPGREPTAFRFANVPGPRTEGAEGMRPPTMPS